MADEESMVWYDLVRGSFLTYKFGKILKIFCDNPL